jgi:PAS domain-containing protein
MAKGAGAETRKLYLILFIVYVLLVLVGTLVAYQRQRAQEMKVILNNASIITGEVLVEMERMKPPYIDTEKKPGVPAYHAEQRKQRLINLISQREKYLIDISSLLNRHPMFRPDDNETLQMRWFSAGKTADSYRVIEEGGEAVITYMRPLRMNGKCLACHGAYQSAPPFVREMFSAQDPIFSHHEGEVAGAVAVKVPMKEVSAAVRENLKGGITAVSLFFLAIIIVTGGVIRRTIIAPLRRVTEQLVLAKETKEAVQLFGSHQGGDVNDLIDAVNRLLESLHEKTMSHVEWEDRYRKMLDFMMVPVLVFTADGTIIGCTDVAERHLGLSRDDMGKVSMFDLLPKMDGLQEWVRSAKEMTPGTTRSVTAALAAGGEACFVLTVVDPAKKLLMAKVQVSDRDREAVDI